MFGFVGVGFAGSSWLEEALFSIGIGLLLCGKRVTNEKCHKICEVSHRDTLRSVHKIRTIKPRERFLDIQEKLYPRENDRQVAVVNPK